MVHNLNRQIDILDRIRVAGVSATNLAQLGARETRMDGTWPQTFSNHPTHLDPNIIPVQMPSSTIRL